MPAGAGFSVVMPGKPADLCSARSWQGLVHRPFLRMRHDPRYLRRLRVRVRPGGGQRPRGDQDPDGRPDVRGLRDPAEDTQCAAACGGDAASWASRSPSPCAGPSDIPSRIHQLAEFRRVVFRPEPVSTSTEVSSGRMTPRSSSFVNAAAAIAEVGST